MRRCIELFTELEILIGETTREASVTGAEGLALNQYKISVVGKKIVISAGCDNALVAAVTAFKEAYFDTAVENVTVPADLLMEGSIPMNETTSVKAGKWNSLSFKASNGTKLLYQIYLPKGYDPTKQIAGYILSEDPVYITDWKNARGKISHINRDDLLNVLINHYLGISEE